MNYSIHPLSRERRLEEPTHRGLLVTVCSASILLLIALAGCARKDEVFVNYQVINHTDAWVVEVTINQTGGILVAEGRGASGRACCVSVPRRWSQDLSITVGWRDDSVVARDDQGKPLLIDGRPVSRSGTQYTRTVAIEPYPEKDFGALYLHILPDRSVVAKVSLLTPAHPDYRPKNPTQVDFKP